MPAENFFDFRERRAARSAAARKPAGRADPKSAMSVADLTKLIEAAIKSGVPSSVLVRGELSNVSHHQASGHLYFTLKDAAACIDCVMFRSDAVRLKAIPPEGQEVLASGRIGLYAQRGRYQLYVSRLQPLGTGALDIAFQKLRAQLEKEGLFEADRKKPIPRYPRRIALVTSRQTAALADMLKVLGRFPFLRIKLHHVAVQGDGAGAQIAGAIASLNRHADEAPELIVLARGGGSLEDLWAFNEETVARAIARSRIPIVTGIGHEVDVSIADLVADYHAHTPTEAAQVVTAHWKVARETIAVMSLRLNRGLRSLVQEARQRLLVVERHEFFRRPLDRINLARQSLDDRQRSMALLVAHRLRGVRARLVRLAGAIEAKSPRHRIALTRQRLAALDRGFRGAVRIGHSRRGDALASIAARLVAVSPHAVLSRGYSITTNKKSGIVVRASTDVAAGDRLVTRLRDGTVESIAQDSRQLPLFE
ncbi:MAG: exodeoxyribonuclease VII large subunit [Tepidisphaeraceae bacterium]